MRHFNLYQNRKKQRALESLNHRIRECQICRLSSTREHALTGEGNADARVMLVALSPGKNEDKEARMFIGPSGQILNKVFNAIGIRREVLFMTNLIKCALPKNRRPKTDEIEACCRFLHKEIAIIHPEVIAPLGYYATRTLLQKYHADPPRARSDFVDLYGRIIFSDHQKFLPLPHPASLLYNPTFEPLTVEKYKKLTTLLNECKWYPFCPMKQFCESQRLERRWIELYCKGDWENCVRYKMEETGRYHPDWMLPDGSCDERLR